MTTAEWARIVYFVPKEFDSKDAPGSGFAAMSWELVSTLDALRMEMGEPIIVLSGYRTPARNEAVGGVKNSEHTHGWGADIRTPGMKAGGDLRPALRLFAEARRFFDRVGFDLQGGFVHVGVSKEHPTPAVWFYNGSVTPVA